MGPAVEPPPAEAPEIALVRESRPAMGTAVGITARAEPGAFAAAWAAIERFEAELSEWRPESATARLVATGAADFSPEGTRLFELAGAVNVASHGAFDLAWRGPGTVDLGGILKGFLADRASDALLAHGVEDFVIDAAGDIVAHGDAGDGRRGWPVTVITDAATWNVRLRDQALSTSAEDRQPGHIVDARTGAAARCVRAVTVTAPEGALADAWATAFYAACGAVDLPAGVRARWVDAEGRRHQTGPRR